jgi:DNA-binding FadR family transcriptional regulator
VNDTASPAAGSILATRRKLRESAVDVTARRILELIKERGLVIGDALPTERELGELCNASRNTVREALRTIRAYGLIEARPRVGAVVADRQTAATHDFFSAQIDLSRSSFHDIQAFRRIVEVGIGDQLILGASNEQLDELDRINDRILHSAGADDAAQRDFDFHIGLMRLTKNRTLIDIYGFLSPVILRVMAVGKTSLEMYESTRATHAEIIAALRARDRVAYAYLMSRHLEFGAQFLPDDAASAPAAG